MKIVADTHLHLYPAYDIGRAFSFLMENLGALSEDAGTEFGFLAERHDCDFFSGLLNGDMGAGPEFEISPDPEGTALLVVRTGDSRPSGMLHLFPGRQVVTRENLEILALAVAGRIPDGLPAAEVVEKTLENGGVPVLAWAPGKWFFGRGRIVSELIRRFDPESLLLGDTTLRPTIWTEPFLMRAAREKGFRIVAGSDPLPFSGEERVMGSYASILDGVFDAENPLASAKDLLRRCSLPVSAGSRGGLPGVIRRLWMNRCAKRRR